MFRKNTLNAFKMLVVLAGIFLSGCFEKKSPEKNEIFYFDIKGFFEKEARDLNTKKISAEKYLINESDTQKLILSNVNWENEFAPFINSDINKPAWKGSYNVDSVYENGNLTLISYKASVKKLPVQQVQVLFENKNITNVYIENSTQNYIYNSVQNLSYYVDKGYAIEGEQDIISGKDMHYRIIINFLK